MNQKIFYSLLLLLVVGSRSAAIQQQLERNIKLSSFAELQQNSQTQQSYIVSAADRLENAGKTSNESSGDVGISPRDFSSNERVAGLKATNDLRRSKGASNMMFTCWETVLASYAQYTAGRCSVNAGAPSNFDSTTYKPDRTMLTWQWSSNRISIADTIQDLHDIGGSWYKVVMQYDLVAMACSQVFCSSFMTGTSYTTNVYVNQCYFNYRSTWNDTGSPFTPGTACSSCPSGTSCDESLCRDYSSYLPALDCTVNSSSKNSSVLALIISFVAFLTALRVAH